MSPTTEIQALEWLERVLERSDAERGAWLDAQALPDPLHARVSALLRAESTLGGFLENAAAPPDPPGFPGAGERVGAYLLLRRLDHGGMGVVYLARRADHAYDQQVAIKLIRPLHLEADAATREQLVARFENERALLARLQHPNVARILDGGSTASGIPWLAMEYVDGVSLTAFCERREADVRERLTLFRKVCDGVQDAHNHLIVHRDLKPENILVGDDGEPKLLDFGIARTLEQTPGRDDPALTALTAMTPAYASPEQVRRESTTTHSDVYSLGVMLYQLLAGVRPYQLDGLSPAEAERTVCHTRPPPLRQALQQGPLPAAERRRRHAQLDPELDRIVAKAMHKEVARRYGSARELAEDIQRHLDGRPVLAHPDSPLYRAGKFARRNRAASIAAAAALLALLGGAGLALWQAHEARQAAADAARINAFLLDVMKLSDPFNTGSELSLSDALDQAVDGIEARFGERPDLSAEIRFGIGYSMLGRSRLDAADRQLALALAESEAAFGPRDARTIRTIDALAYLRLEQGDETAAERLYLDAIARLDHAGLQHDPLYAIVLGNFGHLRLLQGDYAAADAQLRRAVSLAEAAPDRHEPEDRATLIANLAQAAHGLDALERADALYRRAQDLLHAAFPQGHPNLAILLNNRASLADDQDRPALAVALLRESLAMRRAVFRDDHPLIVNALAALARRLLSLDEAADALPLAAEAEAMARRTFPEPDSRHANVLVTLSEARIADGDAAGAARALDEARALLARIDPPAPSIQAHYDRVRARLCAEGRNADDCPRRAAEDARTGPGPGEDRSVRPGTAATGTVG